MSGRKRSTHKRKEALGRPSASLCVCIDKWDRTPTFPPLTDTRRAASETPPGNEPRRSPTRPPPAGEVAPQTRTWAILRHVDRAFPSGADVRRTAPPH